MSYNISIYISSSSDSFLESIAYISSLMSIIGIIKPSLDSSPISALLKVSDNKLPSSNCANVIISTDYSFEYVAQGMYGTAGGIDNASV